MSQLSEVLLDSATNATEIQLVRTSTYDQWHDQLTELQQTWLARQDFRACAGQFAWLDTAQAGIVVGWDGADDLGTLGGLAMHLPEGDYTVTSEITPLQTLGWALGAYQYTRYKDAARKPARLVVNSDKLETIRATADAVALTRNLINTPAADMAPSHLSAEVIALADQYGATCQLTVGDELLDLGAGAIHAVGRAAEDPPCLADLCWGNEAHPKITLIGKGVTFDSGGLDIKPAAGMRNMKKDMGGAATAIGLASLIMATGLPVRLRLLVPMAENAIAGNSFRPGDVLSTHAGLTVEIDNTDAEGRLLLCDALSLGQAEDPELIIDFATLTGSARSAVGAEIAAMFTNSDKLADELSHQGTAIDDPVWRMPLHQDYRHMLNSSIADLVNSAASPYAGSITAALFLERFVGETPWVHFDLMAYNTRNRPARPEGGEAMALRTVYHYLAEHYGTS